MDSFHWIVFPICLVSCYIFIDVVVTIQITTLCSLHYRLKFFSVIFYYTFCTFNKTYVSFGCYDDFSEHSSHHELVNAGQKQKLLVLKELLS